MNKNVLNKLSKIESKVELAEVKVDLAIVDDIKKFMQNALNNKNIYQNEALKAVDSIKKAKGIAIDWRDNLQEANKLIINLTESAKALGIDIPTEVQNYKDIAVKGVKDANTYVQTLNNLQTQIPLS